MVYVSNFPTFAPSKFAVNNVPAVNGNLNHRSLTNVAESADAFRLEMALPGLEKSAISLAIEKNVLVIQAKKSFELPEGFTYNRKELSGYEIERKFELSDLVDREAIKAEMKDGLLVVTLPKKAPQTYQIEIA